MISKAKLKELSSFRQQKNCEEQHLFIVEGVKMVEEAIRNDIPIKTLCCLSTWAEGHQEYLKDLEWYEITPAELERLSLQKSPNQVWALCQRSLSSAPTGNQGLIIALDHIQDPGNLGTIIRTADWFGIRKIVCSQDTVDCFNPKVVQSTMGGIFRTDIRYTDLYQWLSGCDKTICGALLNGESIETQTPPSNAVLVIGNESKGISPEIQTLIQKKLLIPNIGNTAESLNASVATGILMAWFKLRN